MNELLHAVALSLQNFPDILLNIITALIGAIVSVIVAARMSSAPMSTGDVVGQFVVCWATGGVLGPTLIASIIQSVIKLPTFAICFLSSGIGWWFWTKWIPKRQDEIINRKTEEQPPQ